MKRRLAATLICLTLLTGHPQAATCPASANNSTLTASSTSVLTDSVGNGWGIPASGGSVILNGSALPWTSNATGLAYASGTIWYKNGSAQWFSFTSTGTIASGPTLTSPVSSGGPAVVAPTTLAATQNVSQAVTGLLATDATNPNDTMNFTGHSTGSGKLTATGATGNGTATIAFSGTLSALNTLLGTVSFVDAVIETPTLSWSFTDQHSGTASGGTNATVVGAASANCTIVRTIGPTINSAGPPPATWSINASAQVVYNGSALTGTSNVIKLAYVGNVVWQENNALNWYSFTATAGLLAGPTTVDPTLGCVIPLGPSHGLAPQIGPIEAAPPVVGPVE